MAKYRNIEVVYEGIKFDSKLELAAYKYLKNMGIEFKFHEKTFLLHDSYHTTAFSQKTKKIYQSKVSQIKYTPEFIIDLPSGGELILEMKGMATEAFNIRWKLFRKLLTVYQTALIVKSIADLKIIINHYGLNKPVDVKIEL